MYSLGIDLRNLDTYCCYQNSILWIIFGSYSGWPGWQKYNSLNYHLQQRVEGKPIQTVFIFQGDFDTKNPLFNVYYPKNPSQPRAVEFWYSTLLYFSSYQADTDKGDKIIRFMKDTE